MQAAWCFSPTLLPLSKNFTIPAISCPPKSSASLTSRCPPIKAAATAYDSSTVDYSSMISSVFPAEACDVVGGEACLADCCPEVRLKQEARNRATIRTASEAIERDYLEYSDAKTVFRAEACDDIGGLFCEREYQRGVY